MPMAVQAAQYSQKELIQMAMAPINVAIKVNMDALIKPARLPIRCIIMAAGILPLAVPMMVMAMGRVPILMDGLRAVPTIPPRKAVVLVAVKANP